MGGWQSRAVCVESALMLLYRGTGHPAFMVAKVGRSFTPIHFCSRVDRLCIDIKDVATVGQGP